MTERREPSETERLLAEVDGMLTPGGASTVPAQRSGEETGHVARFRARLRGALVAGAVAGAGVWLLFALLPFLDAWSGGWGAFLSVTAVTLVLRRPHD
jgi:hypothetical protein